VLRKLDHLSIYLLIAGSYTPFCLISLRGAWGWSLFGVVWGMAVVGMLQEIKPRSEARVLSLVLYALMGWVVLVAVGPLLDALGTAGFVCLLSGGLLTPAGSCSSLWTSGCATPMASGTCSCWQAAACTMRRCGCMCCRCPQRADPR
jgi:channel protein (hemolysin III family)